MEKVIQTYLQGSRHKINDQPCEDRTYSLSENGVNVIALADGAGSSQYTHAAQGAECSTKAICEFLCNKFDEVYETDDHLLLREVIKTACHRELTKKAEELGLDGIIRLSSTLLCVAVKDNKAISVHIGDGVIGCLSDDGCRIVSEPENGEFASTTYFITLPQANEYLHIDKLTVDEKDAVFFLMSDGTADYCYNDFNNTFKSGAGKLAMLTFDDDGQSKLGNIIKAMLVDNDPTSDDCSFIALRVSDKKPFASAGGKSKSNIKNNGIDTDTDDSAETNTGNSKNRCKRIIFIAIVSALSAVLIIVAAIGIGSHTENKNKNNGSSAVSSTSQKYSTEKESGAEGNETTADGKETSAEKQTERTEKPSSTRVKETSEVTVHNTEATSNKTPQMR